MTINDKIRDEKLQYNITGEATKFQHYHLDKYEYLTGEEILPSNQKQVTEKAKFAFFMKSF